MFQKKYFSAFLILNIFLSMPLGHAADKKASSIEAETPYICAEGGVNCAQYKLPPGDCKKYAKLPTYEGYKFFTPGAPCFFEPNNYKKYLPILECDAQHVLIEGKLSTGKTLRVAMKRKAFSHKIKRNEQGAFVDGAPAYGAEGDKPTGEFSEFDVLVDGKKIEVPAKAYKNFFEPGGSNGFGVISPKNKNVTECGVAVIESKDKKHFYIYMSGSNAAGSYAVKWVFGPEFVTYILDPASDNSSWASVDGVQ